MSWSDIIRLGEIPPAGVWRDLAPDEAQRKVLARDLALVSLDTLTARVRVFPWLDGVQIDGTWSATVTQTCGVTLERMESPLSGDFMVRIVPAGSVHAPEPDEEVEISLDVDDPPDVTEDGAIDLAAYVVEHLALEIDPFPRKPDAEFTPPAATAESSPFDVLKRLQRDN